MSHYESIREKIQELVTKTISSEEWKQSQKKKIIQKDIGIELHYDQSDISKALKGYTINWETGKIEKKDEPKELWSMLNKSSLTRISTFFLTVPKLNVDLKKLKKELLNRFRSSGNTLGILDIKVISNPRGLIIWSDDNNLEYYLLKEEYIKSSEPISTDSAATESSDTISASATIKSNND